METPLQTALNVQTNQAKRALHSLNQTATLATQPPKPETLAEALELAEAARDRAMIMQKQWMDDWAEWASFARSIEGADTLPKFADRTGNIVLQATSLMVNQMSQVSELMDNVNVNYSFWVNRQINRSE